MKVDWNVLMLLLSISPTSPAPIPIKPVEAQDSDAIISLFSGRGPKNGGSEVGHKRPMVLVDEDPIIFLDSKKRQPGKPGQRVTVKRPRQPPPTRAPFDRRKGGGADWRKTPKPGQRAATRPPKPKRPPPPTAKPQRASRPPRRPRKKARNAKGATKEKWKENQKKTKGDRYNKRNTPPPEKKRSRHGYGRDDNGEYGSQFYHDDFGDQPGGAYVDDATGRKKPGVLSYESNAMAGASGLVGGISGKHQTQENYFDSNGELLPPETNDEETPEYLGLRKRTKKKQDSPVGAYVGFAALGLVGLLGLGAAAVVLGKKKRSRRRRKQVESESEAESSDSAPQRPSRKKQKRKASNVKRKKEKKKKPPPESLVSGTEASSIQASAKSSKVTEAETEATEQSTKKTKSAKKKKPEETEVTEATSQVTSAAETNTSEMPAESKKKPSRKAAPSKKKGRK